MFNFVHNLWYFIFLEPTQQPFLSFLLTSVPTYSSAGKESALPGGGVGIGGNRVGNCSLRDPPFPGNLLRVSWESSLCGGRQLSISSPQTLEITAEVGAAD